MVLLVPGAVCSPLHPGARGLKRRSLGRERSGSSSSRSPSVVCRGRAEAWGCGQVTTAPRGGRSSGPGNKRSRGRPGLELGGSCAQAGLRSLLLEALMMLLKLLMVLLLLLMMMMMMMMWLLMLLWLLLQGDGDGSSRGPDGTDHAGYVLHDRVSCLWRKEVLCGHLGDHRRRLVDVCVARGVVGRVRHGSVVRRRRGHTLSADSSAWPLWGMRVLRLRGRRERCMGEGVHPARYSMTGRSSGSPLCSRSRKASKRSLDRRIDVTALIPAAFLLYLESNKKGLLFRRCS